LHQDKRRGWNLNPPSPIKTHSNQMPVDSRMQEKEGVFSLGFQNADIKIDWKNNASYKTPFPKIQKTGFVNECINYWTDTLHLLAPNWGGLLWPRLDPLKRLMTLARKKSPELTIEDAKYHDWEGYNFLEKQHLPKKQPKYIAPWTAIGKNKEKRSERRYVKTLTARNGQKSPQPQARGASNRTANEIQGQKIHRSSIAEKNVLAANRPNYPITT
jgi:hypothetical protein